jgi:phage terminase large subunit GpA-like protein
MAVRGDGSGPAVVGLPSAVENAGTKRRRFGVRVWPVASTVAKETLYGWLRLDAPVDGNPYPPGYVHLPRWCSDDEVKQLTAEEIVIERSRNGFARQTWNLLPGRRNEGLDCWVYAYAAAVQVGLDRFNERKWVEFEQSLGLVPVAETPAPEASQAARSGSGASAPAATAKAAVANRSGDLIGRRARDFWRGR